MLEKKLKKLLVITKITEGDEMNYNEQSKRIHTLNKQWWYDENGNKLDRNRGCLLMLAVTELAESCEGLRKGLMDDHLPQYEMVIVELADTKIRMLDYAGGFDIEIEDHNRYDTGINLLGFDIESRAEGLLYIVNEITSLFFGGEEGRDIRFVLNTIDAYAKHYGYDVEGAIEEKLAYNQQREDHRIENRMKENGKKF